MKYLGGQKSLPETHSIFPRDSEVSIYVFVCHGYIINQPIPNRHFLRCFETEDYKVPG